MQHISERINWSPLHNPYNVIHTYTLMRHAHKHARTHRALAQGWISYSNSLLFSWEVQFSELHLLW